MEKRFLVGIVIISVSASLILSSTALYFVLTAERNWPPDNEEAILQKRIQKRGTADDSECTRIFTAETTKVERDISYLTCTVETVRQQLDELVYEMSSNVYFVNEIGVNMQAAQDIIQENMARGNATFRSVVALNRTVTRLGSKLDRTLATYARRISKARNKTDKVGTKVLRTENILQAVMLRLDRLEQRPGGGQQQIEIGNQSVNTAPAIAPGLQEQSDKNKVMIDLLRRSLVRTRNDLTGFSSEGWFNGPNGYQYYLSKNAFSRNSYVLSRRYCTNKNSHLAYIGMRDEYTFRYLWSTLIGPARHHCVWIGLTDFDVEGRWVWLDGRPSTSSWTNWRVGKPGRGSRLDNCGMIRAGVWEDGRCDGYRKLCSFICERKIFP